MEIYIDGNYRTFTEETPGQLTGKEGYLVELPAGKTTVQLQTTGLAIGVMFRKLQGSNDVSIRLLNGAGTVKVVAGGVIVVGARVKGSNGGTTVDLAGAGRSIGIKISPSTDSALNDVIEILPQVENV